MVKYRKGMALVQYSILLIIVTFALVTMNTYLRRGIQARVKDLTDLCIGRGHIDFLDETEYTKDSTSDYSLVKQENVGGGITLSTTMNSVMTMDRTIWSGDADDLDLGQSVGEQEAIEPTPYNYGDGD